MSAKRKESKPQRVQRNAKGDTPGRNRPPALSGGAGKSPGSPKKSRRFKDSSQVSQPSGSDFASLKGMGSLLAPDELDVLRQMIREYKAHRLDFSVLPRRPRFKKPRVNSGITCNREIRQRALEKAKADPDGTGGSLSGLIEMLLWKYLGSPADVVERFPRN